MNEFQSSIKNHFNPSKQMSFLLVTVFEIQIIMVMFMGTNFNFLKHFQFISEEYIENLAIINYSITGVQIFAFLVILWEIYQIDNQKIIRDNAIFLTARFLLYYKNIFLIPAFYFSFELIRERQNASMIIIPVINILVGAFFCYIKERCCVSYRFRVKNYFWKSGSKIVDTLLVMLMIGVGCFKGAQYGASVIMVKNVFRLIRVYYFYQGPMVQKFQIFHNLYQLLISFMIISAYLMDYDFQQNITYTCVTLLFGITITNYVTSIFSFSIYNNMLKASSLLLMQEVAEINLDNQQVVIQKRLNSIRVISMIFLQKQKHENNQENEFDKWWHFHDRKIFIHKIHCTNIKCKCMVKKPILSDTYIYLKQLLNDLIQLSATFSKQMKLKITTIYMYIQIIKKPLKAYYLLMRMKSQKQSQQFDMQLLDLSVETRECFDKLFLENKVKNQKLQLFKVIQFEQGVQECEIQLKKIVTQTIQFYSNFNYSTIKIASIKQQSNHLRTIKVEFENKLLKILNDYSNNIKLTVLIHIFYNYIQIYQNKQTQLQKISLQQLFKKRLLDKKEINVFSPQFGSIFIDLVQERGKIKNITKSMCTIYGYPKQEMISYNVNMFMPRLFGKHHAQFLHNFIQKGKFNLLKEGFRSVFGKNKRKFLFPMKISLKAEYLLDNFFGSSSLLRPIETFSEFIIVDKQGKIQQMTQGIYKRIFKPSFGEQNHKVSRLQIRKLIPSYNTLLQRSQQEGASYYNKLIQGVMIYSEQGNYLIDKFKLIKQQIRSNKPMSYINNKKYQRNKQILQMTVWQITTETIAKVKEDQDITHLNDMMKSFLIDLQLFLLKGLRISYKVTPIVTAQFQAQLVQIISLKHFPNQQQQYQCILDQLSQLAQQFSFQIDDQLIIRKHLATLQQQLSSQEYLTMYSNLLAVTQLQKSSTMPNLIAKQAPRNIKRATIIFKVQDVQSVQFKQNPLYKFDNETAQKASIYTSINSLQSDSIRQTLINTFSNSDQKIMNSKFSQLSCFGITILVGLLITLLIQSVMYIRLLENQWTSISHVEKMLLIVQYRKSMIDIEEYMQQQQQQQSQQGMQFLQFIRTQMLQLNSHFKQSIQTIYETVVSQDQSNQLYTQLFQLNNSVDVNQSERLSFIYLVKDVMAKFQYSNTASIAYLQQFYQSISTTFTTLVINQQQFLLQTQQSHLLIFYITSTSYLLLILVLSLGILPVFLSFKNEQKTMIQLLQYISCNQLKKSLRKLNLIQSQMNKFDRIDNFQHIRMDIKNKVMLINKENNNINQQTSVVNNNKSPRIITNTTINSTNKLTKYICVGVIIVIFLSSLPIWTMLQLSYLGMEFRHSIDVSRMMYELEMKPARLVNVYLRRVNSLMKGQQQTMGIGVQLQQHIQMNYFSLQTLLSHNTNTHLPISHHVLPLLRQPLCHLLPSSSQLQCSTTNTKQSLTFNYLVYLFKDKFQFLSTTINNQLNKTIDSSDNDKQMVNSWIVENNIKQIVTEIKPIVEAIQYTNYSLWQQYSQRLNTDTIQLTAIGIMLIVINAIVLLIVQHSTFHHFNSVLKQTQNVFSHFDLDTLLENTYLTRYFNDKVKRNK